MPLESKHIEKKEKGKTLNNRKKVPSLRGESCGVVLILFFIVSTVLKIGREGRPGLPIVHLSHFPASFPPSPSPSPSPSPPTSSSLSFIKCLQKQQSLLLAPLEKGGHLSILTLHIIHEPNPHLINREAEY